MNRRATALVAALACSALGACASTSDAATKTSLTALGSSSSTTTTTTTAPPGPAGCDDNAQDASKSLRPAGPLPEPGHMAAGTFMDDILTTKQKLVVGVDENTLLLSARDPKSRQITGLEIDIARAIAAAIGPSLTVELRPVVTADKTRVVADHTVDLTVSAVSMSCKRLGEVLFSTEYFTTDQQFLVRANSQIQHIGDLAGKTVCMTSGSSSIGILAGLKTGAKPMLVSARTDCLVALQEGTADAYFGHETFLYGMVLQDPTMRIVDEAESTQHYGVAIAHEHPDFVRFVNAVLERMRGDGELAAIYDKWLADNPAVPSVPPVPAAQYKD